MIVWNPLYYGVDFEFDGEKYTVGIGGNDKLFDALKKDERYSIYVCELEAQ